MTNTNEIDSKQMARLNELVHQAQAYVERPWKPDETQRPLTFYTDHLPQEAWQLGWTLVNALHDLQPDLFEAFSETTLLTAALDAVLNAETVPTAEDIASVLGAQAAEAAGKWIIAVPLANTAPKIMIRTRCCRRSRTHVPSSKSATTLAID